MIKDKAFYMWRIAVHQRMELKFLKIKKNLMNLYFFHILAYALLSFKKILFLIIFNHAIKKLPCPPK